MERTDEELMHAYCQGEPRAFAELYQRHSGRLYSYCIKKCPDRSSADDLFQAIFAHLHTARFKYETRFPFSQWLYVIARHVWIDRLRKQGRQVKIAEDADLNELSQNTPSGALSSLEELGGYEEQLKPLSPEQRKIVTMRVIEERTFEEISRSLNKTEVSVRQILSRALRKLRNFQGGEA